MNSVNAQIKEQSKHGDRTNFSINIFFVQKGEHKIDSAAGLPDFSWDMIPKLEKMYQMNTKCTIWSKNISKVCEILQMAIKYINIFQSKALQDLPKFGFFV
jgi:hypothetical protein